MNRIFILTLCMCCCISSMGNILGQSSTLDFDVCIVREGIKGHPKPRKPIKCPSASINGHTLYIDGCDGSIIQLLDGDDIIYSAVVADGVIELPVYLTGIYELQIIRGDYCFWAEIEL